MVEHQSSVSLSILLAIIFVLQIIWLVFLISTYIRERKVPDSVALAILKKERRRTIILQAIIIVLSFVAYNMGELIRPYGLLPLIMHVTALSLKINDIKNGNRHQKKPK